MRTKKTLEAVRIRWANANTRCVRVFARDRKGEPCDPKSSVAVQWSLLGALLAECGCVGEYRYIRTYLQRVGLTERTTEIVFSDVEVLQRLDRAIYLSSSAVL